MANDSLRGSDSQREMLGRGSDSPASFGDIEMIDVALQLPTPSDHVGMLQTIGGGENVEVKSNIYETSFNFTNSILGAGIFGLPFAFTHTGLFFGMILLAMVLYLIIRGIDMLITTGNHVGIQSYEDLCMKSFGTQGFYASSIFMFLLAYGAMVAYFIIIGDTIPPLVESASSSSAFADRSFIIILFGFLFILPLCLLRDLARLSKFSLLSVFLVVVIVIMVASRASTVATENGISASTEDSPYAFAKPTFIAGLGTMTFSFVCHHNSFIVYNSLENPTAARWSRVTIFSVVCAGSMCMIMVFIGYLNFFSNLEGDILNNFSSSDKVINVGRVFLSITMVLTYPMEQFVARHALISMIQKYTGDPGHSDMVYYGVTISLWLSSLIIALCLNDLGVVLEVTGDLSASALGFILPPLLLFREGPKNFQDHWDEFTGSWTRGSKHYKENISDRITPTKDVLLPCFMVVLGIVCMTYGTYESISEALEE